MALLVFVVLSGLALFIDCYFHRKDRAGTLASASLWSAFYIAVALAFAGYLYISSGSEMASLFMAGYMLEKALSIDNLFVIMAIFAYFKIPDGLRHRVLYYGIAGAIIFRLIFVLLGASLLKFGGVAELIFAIVVGLSAVLILKGGDDEGEVDYSKNIAYKAVYRFFAVLPNLKGNHFFVSRTSLNSAEIASLKRGGAFVATPLFLCLGVIEISDVMFAFDSVPAVIAVSKEPLIIYSAMIFAILGLRSLYFVLEALAKYLAHLEKAVIAVLFFISIKLALNASLELFGFGYHISPNASLCVIAVLLMAGVLGSFVFKEKD